jgi:hypothetical protein
MRRSAGKNSGHDGHDRGPQPEEQPPTPRPGQRSRPASAHSPLLSPLQSPKQPTLRPSLAALRAAFRHWQQARITLQATRQRRELAEAKLHFEALEPRILLDAEPSAGVLTLVGSIDVPGEQDHYQFSVDETSRIILDSLSNRSDLSWRLDGPGGLVGQRSFSATDSPYTALPAYDLTPGHYQLRVDGTQDALGAYSLRVIDAASAAVIAPDTPVSDVLEVGNQTAAYRFRASAGDSYLFKATAPASASLFGRLLDPFGRQEGSSFDARHDSERFTVQHSGEYLLLLEGAISNQAALAYEFTLQAIVDSVSPLRLGETQIAHIDQPGKVAHFNFDLAAATAVIFDRLSNAGFAWSLSGPAGQLVTRQVEWQNALFDGLERLLLPPGSYTLSIEHDGAGTGSFPFRLLAADSAQEFVAGAVTTGQLERATASQLYKIVLNAGDKLFLEPRALAGGALNWRLVDPWGVRVAGAPFRVTANPADPADPAAIAPPFTVTTSGEYWLLLDGTDSNAADAALTYEFSLHVVPDLARPLTLGKSIAETIVRAGRSTVFTFDLAGETQVAFAAQSLRSDIVWSLAGPRGREVADRPFDDAEGSGDGASKLSILTLPAGEHQLTVRGIAAASGDFSFRLLDLAAAPILSLDDGSSAVLTPANSTRAYRFLAQAGDQIALENMAGSSGSDGEEGVWRLIDRFGATWADPAPYRPPASAPTPGC